MFQCWTVIFIEGQMAHTHTYCLLLYTHRERILASRHILSEFSGEG